MDSYMKAFRMVLAHCMCLINIIEERAAIA